MRGADGDRFDFKGEHGGIYILLSTQHLSLAGRFFHSAFKSPFSKLKVRGSFIRAAYWTVRTGRSKLVKVAFSAGGVPTMQREDGALRPIFNRSSSVQVKVIDDIRLIFEPPHGPLKGTLAVITPKWRTRVLATKGAPHWGQLRMDVQTQPLFDVASDTVAPQ